MSESIQERIASIAEAMHGGDPSPAEIRGYEINLAGLQWLANKAATQAEIAFRVAVLGASTHTKSNAAARMVAEAGPAGAALLEAECIRDSCHQMLITCRSASRSISEEMRLARG